MHGSPFGWGNDRPETEEGAVAQPVTAILARQGELAEKARQFTHDANEAGLLVTKVMLRAFDTFDGEAGDDLIGQTMRRDLDRLIEKLRKARF